MLAAFICLASAYEGKWPVVYLAVSSSHRQFALDVVPGSGDKNVGAVGIWGGSLLILGVFHAFLGFYRNLFVAFEPEPPKCAHGVG